MIKVVKSVSELEIGDIFHMHNSKCYKLQVADTKLIVSMGKEFIKCTDYNKCTRKGTFIAVPVEFFVNGVEVLRK